MENCVFCGIISGHVPGTKVAEDDLTLTFMDINPAADGHMLVIPKFHSEDLLEIDAEDLTAVQRQYVETIRGSGSHLLSIINDCCHIHGYKVLLEAADDQFKDPGAFMNLVKGKRIDGIERITSRNAAWRAQAYRDADGDIGITLALPGPDGDGPLRVAFPAGDGSGGIKWVQPSRLQAIETVYALTVHKSQGSEFTHTAMALPERLNPILTRELVYTGITRAKRWFSLVEAGSPAVLEQAVGRRVLRVSGLSLETAVDCLRAQRSLHACPLWPLRRRSPDGTMPRTPAGRGALCCCLAPGARRTHRQARPTAGPGLSWPRPPRHCP